MSTNAVSAKTIQRKWHLIDAKNQVLGRVSTQIATLLMGKNKSNYVPYLDLGDNVVVINADKVKVTGKKESQKVYFRHSGYPGGDKKEILSEVRAEKPDQIITHAVKGMLPKNKLAAKMIKKLHVFKGTEHPFKKQFTSPDLIGEKEKEIENAGTN